jgi:hypothetical protein
MASGFALHVQNESPFPALFFHALYIERIYTATGGI